MMTTRREILTIKKICEGFHYDRHEGKGLYGLNGHLTIQPEYQRNYVYAEKKMDADVILSVLNKYPLGLFYFNEKDNGDYEVLDGQQRITSIGRFVEGQLAVMVDGLPKYYSSLSQEQRDLIDNTELLVIVCKGEEDDIHKWFEIINMGGVKINEQELLNAVYSGEFVTTARKEYSNPNNKRTQMWSSYLPKTEVNRQDFLAKALQWISTKENTTIRDYMSSHRHESNIDDVKTYFDSVISWVDSLFETTRKEMKSVDWQQMYELYHNTPYNLTELNKNVDDLFADVCVCKKSGIYEYVLGGCKDTTKLEVRVFDDRIKATVYQRQTTEATKKGESNCPYCAMSSNDKARVKIWKIEEMDADHVTAWSKGGSTDISNCQMLCKTHNRSKGNS